MKSAIFLAHFLTLARLSWTLEILETSPYLHARQESPLELTCSGSGAWDLCRWTFEGQGEATSCQRTMQSSQSFCNMQDGVDRIKWKGVPIITNKCSLLIDEPADEDAGKWRCLLWRQGDDEMPDEEASHNVQVSIFSRTRVSFGSRPYKQMRVGQEYRVECTGHGGVPEPELTALVGPSPDVNGEGNQPLKAEKTSRDDGSVTTLFLYNPTKDHQHLYLKCMAVQTDPAEAGRRLYEPSSVSSQFEVVFPPLPLDEPVQTFQVDLGRTTDVSIAFYANPVPSNDNVIWHIVRQSSNQSQTIQAGREEGRFEAGYVQMEDGTTRVTANLRIYETELQDSLNYCYLEVINDLGRFEYNFQLEVREATNRPPFHVEDEEDEEATTAVSVGLIVGIVIGSILLICAVVILVCFVYQRKYCCFAADKTQADKYMSVEQRDNEAQNSNVASGRYESHDEVDEHMDEGNSPIIRNNPNVSGTGPSPTARTTSYQIATHKD